MMDLGRDIKLEVDSDTGRDRIFPSLVEGEKGGGE